MVGRPVGSINKTKDRTLENYVEAKEKEKEMECRMKVMLKELEVMKKGLEEGFARIAGEMRESLKKQMEQFKRQMRKEREGREEEKRKEKQEWKQEKEGLVERIWILEKEYEKREKEKRKRNIIIREVNFDEINVEKEIENFLQEQLKVAIIIEKVHLIKVEKNTEEKKLTLATLGNWQMKLQVMKKERELKRGIYIDDDLTRRERELQEKVRRAARQEKEKGRKVRIGCYNYADLYLLHSKDKTCTTVQKQSRQQSFSSSVFHKQYTGRTLLFLVEQYNKFFSFVTFYPYNMSEVFAEHIADSLSDYSIHSEDSDVIIEDSDSDVGPRRRSRAVPLQDSSDPDDSDNSTDCEMPTESHNYKEVWSDVDEIPNIPDFTELLMTNGTRVCGTIRQNRGVPESLRHLKWKTGEYRWKRKGEVLVQAWKPKQKVVYMISTIHSAELMKANKTHWKTKQEIIKPHSVTEYNKYMMGVDLADQYLSYYHYHEKNCEVDKEDSVVSFKLRNV
ncbi:hypothetical protein KPH14_011615 [Odynerus spinipes]|uniref:PiggyBac transposable element-derived protein domain-containing protein n=1 Tax=Odynerus spinipes TaxID=1348599 RepID=A0AAD9VKR9_9HYME|nr:hypothetical protein KPH14_011615 [Odynerus spinipes]